MGAIISKITSRSSLKSMKTRSSRLEEDAHKDYRDPNKPSSMYQY